MRKMSRDIFETKFPNLYSNRNIQLRWEIIAINNVILWIFELWIFYIRNNNISFNHLTCIENMLEASRFWENSDIFRKKIIEILKGE